MGNDRDELLETSGDVMFGDDFDTAVPDHAWATLKRLWSAAWDQHLRLLAVLVCVLFYTVLSIAAPAYSAGIVNLLWDNIQAADALGQAFSVTWQQGGAEICILLLLYLGSWLFYTLQSYWMVSFAETLNLHLRTELSEKLNRLPLSYFDRTKTGATLSHFTNDLDKMSEALQTGVLKLFTSVGLIIGSVVMMFRYNMGMTLIFLGSTILSLLVTRLFSRATLQRASRRQQAMGAVTGLVEEFYSGRVILKAFHQEEASSARIHAANEEMAQATEQADFLINAINPAIRLVTRVGQMLIAAFAGWNLIQGRLSVGAFQAFFQYVNQASEPLTEASYVLNSMQSALASAERVFRMLDAPEVSEEPARPQTVRRARGQVEFRHVSFGYTPDRLLMRDISFTARPGQKIAIVGATGAGKTTLINLLMRFYDVLGGSIKIDGVDIRDMRREDLRRLFGMVLQDTWLFSGTIYDNIRYGRLDARNDEIIEASKMANVDHFIRTLPDGYNMVINEEGNNISQGEKQLLTIARAILKDPQILILDEATSSVDTRLEKMLQEAMTNVLKNRTSFVIAHRLSTIRSADLILVIDHGNIVEQGTHESLMAQHGYYEKLYNSQFADMQEN